MKKLIVAVFLVQMLVLAALGIPAGGAANAVWHDESTGLVVSQDTPENTVKSYYELLDHKGYDAVVNLFTADIREQMNGDLIEAYYSQNQIGDSRLVDIFASNTIGNYAVVGTIRLMDYPEEKDQAVLSLLTLKNEQGKWELVQQLQEDDLTVVKQIYERAYEVLDRIMMDPLEQLNEKQQMEIAMQVQGGLEFVTDNIRQIQMLLDAQE